MIAYSVPASGFYVVRGCHLPAQIDTLMGHVRTLKAAAPFQQPSMRDGSPLSVKVSSWGSWGWWGDKLGIRYVPRHPGNNRPWPALDVDVLRYAMPMLYESMKDARGAVPGWTPAAWGLPDDGSTRWWPTVDTCLVNYYAPDAALGWHVDKSEKDLNSPILTMSLGASAVFEIKLAGDTHRVTLHSGDGCVMAGASRNAEHRIVKLLTPAEVAAAGQADMFQGPAAPLDIYNPITNGSRLSITWRRTGLAKLP